jgi:hypothetical protein
MGITNEYTPQVGDQVRRPNWTDIRAITVTAVGEQVFLGKVKDSMTELTYRHGKDYPWVKVEPLPTYPERWINVYPWLPVGRDLVGSYLSRDLADQNAGSRRIAVIHLASDGTVTLHPTTGGAS